MRLVEPSAILLAAPAIDWAAMAKYFEETGYSSDWFTRMRFEGETISDIEAIDEFAGRRCYRSFGIGDNPNITQVREDSGLWYDNTLSVKHGSVFEHGMLTFALENISRVCTHELVRHRVGVGISQESMRFVRLTDIPFWFPEWMRPRGLADGTIDPEHPGDTDLIERCIGVLEVLENHQRWMGFHFGLEKDENEIIDLSPLYMDKGKSFKFKKFVTSFMRRFAPEGVATGMVWSANIRTARFVIEKRTEEGAEEEIRLLFSKVADICVERFPLAFGDFEKIPVEDSNVPAYVPRYSKV